MNPETQDLLRRLPAVDAVLAAPPLTAAADRHGRALATAEARRQVEGARQAILSARKLPRLDALALAEAAAASLDRRSAGRVVEVLNATGVLVHTNLGRAPLGQASLARVAERARGAVNLELDLATGRRGQRSAGSEELLVELTGAEAACVVNNNAAALVLALNTFALGRSVVVSRGELVEIGGSFRVPDICERAGVALVEVGTTNRTRLADYQSACLPQAGPPPGLLLKVHPSNFRVVGFTEETALGDLVPLGRERGIPVVMDQGSGALEDLSRFGVRDEPCVPDLVATGADLVLFSGDKLLGGPQAGCIVGRKDAVAACRRNPLFRALRLGRLPELALEATLWAHASGRLDDVPVQAQLRMPAELVRARAARLVERLSHAVGSAATFSLEDGSSTTGGGSSPGSEVPTVLLRIQPASLSADQSAAALRSGAPPVLARIGEDALLLDLRTVPPERDGDLAAALEVVFGGG